MKIWQFLTRFVLMLMLVSCVSQKNEAAPLSGVVSQMPIEGASSSPATKSTTTDESLFSTETVPSPTSTTTSTSLPPATNESYCDQLARSNPPTGNFQQFCDEEFNFALEYPNDWKIDGLMDPTPDPTIHPLAMLQGLTFHDINMENSIQIFTFRMPEDTSLDQVVRNDPFYTQRAFETDYSPMQLAGKPAFGFVNRWRQDYNSCRLYFEGEHTYTYIHIKIISESRLDVSWHIVRSIQSPAATPNDNVISEELIQDAYRLLQ